MVVLELPTEAEREVERVFDTALELLRELPLPIVAPVIRAREFDVLVAVDEDPEVDDESWA